MALNPISISAPITKPEIKKSLILKSIKKPTVKKLSDPSSRGIKILGYGHTGTGKTLALVGFLKANLKILVISTDFGGEGLTAVYTQLKEEGIFHFADNLYHVELETYDQVEAFVKDPQSIMEEVFDVGINMIVWDGFSGFQQGQLSEYISDQDALRGDGGKEVSDLREAGLLFERTDWGAVKTGTTRNLNRFLRLNNRKSGDVWHKYITCLESGKMSQDVLSGENQRGPLIQTAASALIAPAFDVIIRFAKKTKRGAEKDGGGVEFTYQTVGNDKTMGKSRGIKLEPEEEPDMFKVWMKISDQLGLIRNET